MSKQQEKKPVSLVEFAHNRRVEERKATCAICKLPETVRVEVRAARHKKIDRETIGAWLKAQGYKVDDLDWQTHNAGLHETRAERRPA